MKHNSIVFSTSIVWFCMAKESHGPWDIEFSPEEQLIYLSRNQYKLFLISVIKVCLSNAQLLN